MFTPQLATSLHRGGDGSKFVRSMIRTSKKYVYAFPSCLFFFISHKRNPVIFYLLLLYISAWLQEHENATLPKIRQRLEVLTGLKYIPETASEYFQVLYYDVFFILLNLKIYIFRLLITGSVDCIKHIRITSSIRM